MLLQTTALGLTLRVKTPIMLVPLRGRAVAARRAHNPEVSGSNPLPATIFETTIAGRFSLNLYKSSFYQENLRSSTDH